MEPAPIMQIAEEALNVVPVLDQDIVVGAASIRELFPCVGAEQAGARAGSRYARGPLQSWRHAQECAPSAPCGFYGRRDVCRHALCVEVDQRPGGCFRAIVDELPGARYGAR